MKIKKIIHRALRYHTNKNLRKNLIYQESNPITIISSDCIGGVILHELGLPFKTPTINLYFYPKSYIDFISDLETTYRYL